MFLCRIPWAFRMKEERPAGDDMLFLRKRQLKKPDKASLAKIEVLCAMVDVF